MANKMESLVREATSTTGDGVWFVLAGAVAGHRSFAAAYANFDQFWYEASNGSQFEEGIGQYNATNGIFRSVIKSSDGEGVRCNFTTPPEVYVSMIGPRARIEGPWLAAYKTATQSIPASIPTSIIWDAKEKDTHGLLFTGNDQITPGQAGLFEAQITVDSVSGFGAGSYVELWKSGVPHKRSARANNPLGLHLSTQVEAAAGDYFHWYVFSGSAATIQWGQALTWMQFTYIRPLFTF